jgi:hypothetical protein
LAKPFRQLPGCSAPNFAVPVTSLFRFTLSLPETGRARATVVFNIQDFRNITFGQCLSGSILMEAVSV